MGSSSGPSGMESIGGKVMTCSGESSRIPMFLFCFVLVSASVKVSTTVVFQENIIFDVARTRCYTIRL